MNFLNFCAAHGILLDHYPPVGVWKRYPTEDKPRKRNGAVKFMGDHGFVQNHATDVEVSVWKSDGNNTDSEKFVKLARKADDDRLLMKGCGQQGGIDAQAVRLWAPSIPKG